MLSEPLTVIPISPVETYQWLLLKHYARRKCPISYAFGAYRGNVLVGVVTFGVPVSGPLCRGVCGKDYADKVFELNRLCCENEPNVASTLVGRALRLLPHPTIIVSYADSAMGHIGFVYQATNFIYTGLSSKWTDKMSLTSGVHHNRHHKSRPGEEFIPVERSRKHRYVYFVGSKKQQKEMRIALRYKVEPYPKGESKRYDASAKVARQMRLI